MAKPSLLQLCPFSPAMEAQLGETFAVTRFFQLSDADADAWLSAHGGDVRAIATGGHIGASNPLMERLPQLGIVAINGVGFDKVDLDYARGRGIRVTTTPNVLTNDVADLAIGLTISMLRGLSSADRFVRAGLWPTQEKPLARTVSGRKYGVVGLGNIGRAIADRLAVFGPVAYTGPNRKDAPYEYVADLKTLAEQVDVLVVAMAANANTYHLIDTDILDALGPQGYIVNVARGSVIDEKAMIAALQEGRIAGAALDVFAAEPNVPSELVALPDVVLTPHIASATVETRQRMAELVVTNLRAFVAGDPLPSALV